jgi:hypothetical protein
LQIAKSSAKKKICKGIFDEYGIKEKSPFGLADKIREMNDEEYQELKGKFKKNSLQDAITEV